MPQIDIQSSTFELLKKLAEPFVDTPETVILRALKLLESGGANGTSAPTSPFDLVIDSRNIPNLTHTKLITAKFDDKVLPSAKWNSALDDMLVRARKAGLKATQIQNICGVNVKEGKKNDEGYSYIEEFDFSIQGQDSNAACRGIVAMAKYLKISVSLEFMWRDKDGAAHPGKTARLAF